MNINIEVSRFSNYKSKLSNGKINLWEWLLVENLEYNYVIDKIRLTNDIEVRRQLKSQLPAITPSGIFSERRADKIEAFTGIICIDIDGKDNPHFADFEKLKGEISQIPHILYCGLSVSGKGLFALIPLAYPEKHKQHFYALEKDFKEMGITIDSNCSDICRLRGYSYDKNAFININAIIYENYIEMQPLLPKERRIEIIKKEPNLSDILNYSLDNIRVLTVYSTLDDIRILISKIVEFKIDITKCCKDWFAIGCILANSFGEEGRILFHEISKFYPRYTIVESDNVFSKCLQSRYKYNRNKIFEIARKCGIE